MSDSISISKIDFNIRNCGTCASNHGTVVGIAVAHQHGSVGHFNAFSIYVIVTGDSINPVMESMRDFHIIKSM